MLPTSNARASTQEREIRVDLKGSYEARGLRKAMPHDGNTAARSRAPQEVLGRP